MSVTADFYNESLKETIPCSLCGRDKVGTLAQKSVNGLPARTVICKNCGLIYISPRMTKHHYDRYYNEFYRADRAHIKQMTEDINYLFESSHRFGRALALRIKSYIKPGRMLDVGSSTGGVLKAMQESVSGVLPLGVEPSQDEALFANAQGITTEHILFEDWIEKKKDQGLFQTIMCLQTLNHLLDPGKFFAWSYEHLALGGVIILSVKDWRFQVRRAGSLPAGVQIDHPYMFTPEVLKRFLESVGFSVVFLEADEGKTQIELDTQKEKGLNRHHILIVGEKQQNTRPTVKKVYSPGLYCRLRLSLNSFSVRLWHILFYSKRLRRAPWRR